MKVYVIECGYYSDRHVVGVVETQGEAEQVSKILNNTSYDSSYASWREFDTNQFTVKQMRFLVGHDDEWTVRFDDYDLYDNYQENSEVYEGFYVIYAMDSDVAIKIAQDLEARIKAEKLQLI